MSDSSQPPNQPPAGFYPDGSGEMRWWDGNAWTEHKQASPPAETLPAAAWHRDPSGGNHLRYWDGSQWTDHTAPMSGPASVGQASSAQVDQTSGLTRTDKPPMSDGAAIAWIKNHKTLSGIGAAIVALFVIGALVSPSEDASPDATATLVDDSEPTAAAESEASKEPSPEPPPSPEPTGPAIPKKQEDFLGIVEGAAQKAASGNEIAVVNARKARGGEICALMPALKATNWVGEIEDVSTELGGDAGVVMIRLTDDIAAGTWNNSLSDIEANSMINPNSSLFNDLAELNVGDPVTFSGQFVQGPDCLEEQSLVDENGMLTPDFTFKFDSIK